MLKIDFENHFYDNNTIKIFTDHLAKGEYPYYDPEKDIIQWNKNIMMPQGPLLDRLLEVAEGRINVFDQVGIDRAVLSTAGGPEALPAQEAIPACAFTNKLVYELTKKFPDRYYGSAVLPVHDVDAAIAELEKCVNEYGFVSWHTNSNYGGAYPDEAKFRPIFEKAAELGVYVYLHPNLPADARYEGFGFTFAGPGLGFTVDTMTTLMRMVVSGLFDEIPNLKVVVGHLGEALPFLLERIENRLKFLPNPAIKLQHDFSYYFKNNIWVTTSGNMSPEAFQCTKDVLGIDRIIFASDYPFESAEEMMTFLNGLPLTQEEAEKLFETNALGLINK